MTVPLKDPAGAVDTQRLVTDIVAILGSITVVTIVAIRWRFDRLPTP